MQWSALRARVAVVVSAAVGLTLAPIEVRPAQATMLPAVTSGMREAASKLVQSSLLAELNELVPGLATNPAQLFDLHDPFARLLTLVDGDDLETRIDALDGDGFTFSDVSASDGDPKDTLSFDLAIDRTIPVELGIIDGDVQLLGGEVDVHVTMPATTITAEHDPSVGGGQEFALTNLPTFDITISMDEDLDESLQFGFADAAATGTFHVASTVSLQLSDPDASGRLTLSELATADVSDVLEVSFDADTGTDELSASLTLTANVAGVPFTGTVTIADEQLFQGDEPSVSIDTAGPNPIELLTNLGPDSALAGLNQVLSAFGAGMIAGDQPLPFLDGGVLIPAGLADDFDQVFDAVKPLYDYVQARSVQLNCGAFPPGAGAPTPTDNVPVLPATQLVTGQYVACRAFAGEAPRAGTDVTWTPTAATRLTSVADSFTSVAVEPTTSVIFQMTADGDFATTLTFTPDDTGVELTVQQRAQTIQQLLAELEDAGALPADAVTWDANLEALVLDLSFESATLSRSAGVDAGNGLAAGTHLTGLSSSADVSFDVGPVAADLSVGMILTEDAADIGPAPSSPGSSTESRRFFVKVPDSGNVLSVDNVGLSGNAAFEGRLGFLEVNGSAGLTTSKPDADAPAFAVQLQSPTGVQIDGGGTDANAMLIAELLADPLAHIDVATNLQVEGDVSLTAQALVADAGAGFEFSWPLGGSPTVSNVTTELDSLIDFDASETLTVSGATTAATGAALNEGQPVEIAVTVTATDLTTKPGLVGAVLTRSGQPDCQITAVTSNSTLSCTLTAPAGGVDAAAPLPNGDYEVVGNTLSHLAEILDAIAAFADQLQIAMDGANLGDDVEIWGIKPADIAVQAKQLELLVNEMRGIADAVLTCTPSSPELELRGLPAAQGAITCHAGNGNTAAANVRWRIVDTDAGTGDWQTDADGTTVGTDTNATQALTVPASVDQNGDGFLAMGTEWSAVVEWSDAQGDHRASLPPPTPGSLTRLEQLVQSTLGLPDDVLTFGLDTSGGTPTLTIGLGYGICSSTAPAELSDECAGLPTGPTPSPDIAFSIGDESIAALELTGAPQLQYAALGQFNLGVPLDGSEPEIRDDTGLQLTALLDTQDLGLSAILGPFSAEAGTFVEDISGTALIDSADGVLVVDATLAGEIPDGARIDRTSDHAGCVVTGHAADPDSNGNIALTCTGVAWEEGDAFSVLMGSELKGQLGLDVTLDPGPISTTSVDVAITGLDEDCGPLPGGDEIPTPLPTGDAFACARLALGLGSGDASAYLGEIGVDVVDTDSDPLGFDPAFAVVVPADLEQRLLDAVLDPSFLLQALPGLLRDIAEQLRDLAEGIPSAVGDPLRSAAEGLEGIADAVGEVLDLTGADLTSIEGIRTALTNALNDLLAPYLAESLAPSITVLMSCHGGEDDCTASDGPGAVQDISVQLNFGDTIEASTEVNLGLEGLPLSVQGGVSAGASWSLSAGVGLSREHGPYINGPTATLDAFVRFDENDAASCSGILPASVEASDYALDRCLKARLGFLDVEAVDKAADGERTAIEAAASIGLEGGGDSRITFNELTSGDVNVTAGISGALRVDLALRTGIAGTGADLPSVLGTLLFTADASTNAPASMNFEFGDLHLDVGTYLANFLKPVIDGINDVISPFLPIIDVINAPIPVVSDLAALVGEPPVTMISLLEAATGADLGMVRAILSIVQFVGTIGDVVDGLGEDATNGSLQIPLGGLLNGFGGGFPAREPGQFSVNTNAASQTTTPENRGSFIGTNNGGSGFVNDIAGDSGGSLPAPGTDGDGRPTTFGVPGLSFPFLDDASQIFGLLVGRDATLIRWDAGTMEASAGLSWDFGPIMVGPVPITISIGGEIGIRGRFAIGYDTVGIRKLIDGGSAASLLDGIFIDDLDAQGNDVNEVEFFGRVWAGAAVDLVIISAGVKGGIELTFGLNLNDSPDPDGKLRIDEILDKLANPICLFDVNGRIEAFLAVFVKIDLFFFTEEYSFELVRITLLEWSSACEPPAPDLAEDAGNVLYLNVGSRAPTRNVAVDDTDEKMEVRQLGDGSVRVSGYGIEETADGIDLIVFDAGNGDDEILFLPGGAEGNPIPFTIPVAGSGGPGSDIVKIGGEAAADGGAVGGAGDLIRGDDSLSGVTQWAGIDFTPVAGMAAEADETFADFVEPGAGNDTVTGSSGKDTLSGGLGDDSLDGGTEDDRITGGPGNDVVKGDTGNDTLSGGPSKEASAADDDVIVGDDGTDTITGDVGNDVLFGDGSAGTVSGSPTLTTTALANRADWASWCDGGDDTDLITGNDGDDILIGGGGDDQLLGNAGDDKAKGCDGADLIAGDQDEDELHGDAGTDTINGGPGNDVLRGGTEDDVAHGDADQDVVFGDEGADLLWGDDGDDLVVGDTGSTSIAAFGIATDGAPDPTKATTLEAAVDHSHAGDGARRANCDPASATGNSDCVFGGTGSDALFGTGDGDVINGDAGVDLIVGDAGNDLVRGGADPDAIFGSAGDDELFGESSDDVVFGDRAVAAWPTDTPAADGGTDQLFGGPGPDRLEGDGGADTILGGADDDDAEGNGDADTVHGESGHDDVIGGSDTAGVADTGDTLLTGGVGRDVIAGDNALVAGTNGGGGYVLGRNVTLLDLTIGGGDTIEGDADTDALFGQLGNDTISGDHGSTLPFTGAAAPDYAEGGDGDDTIAGEDGSDDLVGGGSAGADGVVDADRVGDGLPDGGETSITGGNGVDWIAGDNARANRVLGGSPDYPDAAVEPIVLFDVANAGEVLPDGTSGGDTLSGDGGDDYVFGQGGDDAISGGTEADYVEGNAGDDAIAGDDGDDDLVGGGSADDGVVDRDRLGNTLVDGGETLIEGGNGIDWIAGDNAVMDRVLFDDTAKPVTLNDVNSTEPSVSGGDTIAGDAGEDRIWGQGNGAQDPGQSDPADGLDNDGDGAVDEDAATWAGDVISGGADDDEIEGNHGSDLVSGDAGNDDLAGGGSAIDGVIDADRLGNGLLDARDTVHGGDGDDVAGGDNARILPAASGVFWLADARDVLLFDVNAGDPALSGGDFVTGGVGDDVIFGQGNGAQDPGQADPLDGYDNDLDGRESAASAVYDCEDGVDNDGDGSADGADGECAALTDEDQPWAGDVLVGNEGLDVVEGNHGADVVEGDDGQDILLGGGSSISGAIVAGRDSAGLHDGPDVIRGGAGHDAITGDNAVVDPVKAGAAWAHIAGFTAGPFDLLERTVAMTQVPDAPGNFANDHLLGGDDHDQLYGQQGQDLIEGNAGDDGAVGDLGTIVNRVEGGAAQRHIAPRQPFFEDDIFGTGTLTRQTTLFSQVTGQGGGDLDVILGGQGHDDLHGGPGDDFINGDRFAPPASPDPNLIEMIDGLFEFDQQVDPYENEDAIFGGYGNDVLWGGRGPDHVYGGWGQDALDVRPRPASSPYPADPPTWFTWAGVGDAEDHYQDSDWLYGGWDADRLQANLSKPGPHDGDRLVDWEGAFNAYYVCPGAYGDWTITRAIAPGMLEYVNDLAAGDGLVDVATPGSSGYLELGLVYRPDVKHNANPPHPENPAHFYCGPVDADATEPAPETTTTVAAPTTTVGNGNGNGNANGGTNGRSASSTPTATTTPETTAAPTTTASPAG